MYHGVAMKRTSAVFVTLGLVLILALLIPLANVSADTIKYTKNFGRAATTYTGSISMPSSSFSISESASWITATRTSYYNFKITISENTLDYRSATVKVVNGGTIFNYEICQSAGRFLVTFDNNNGTGGPGTQYKLYSSSITISNIEPTKSGYTFLGWSASSTATAATYLPGATYSTLSSSKLYAVWRQKTVCTVTLWGNGGTLDANNEEIANYQVYQNDTFILNTTAHRTGYAFQGFATEALATTISYSPSPYTRIPISQNLNLYAIWKGIEYTITFDVNAGDATCSETSRKVSYNDKLGSLPTPTRPDYEFLGWYTESGYQRTSISIMGMANLKLVARWKQINCTLTYDANALTATGTPTSVTVKNGTMVTISETRPTRKGYTFMGWATTATATSPNYWYHMGESIKLEADLKLFAVWEQNICGIVFDANGGLIEGTSDERYGYSINQYDWIGVTATAVRTGYTFKGWAFVEDAEVPDYIPNENIRIEVSTNLTFCAVWEEIQYTLVYDVNGGESAPNSETALYEQSVVVSSICPTLTGYQFLGWSDTDAEADSGYAKYTSGSNITMKSNLTLFAAWEIIPSLISSNAENILELPNDDTDSVGRIEVTLSGKPNTRYRVHIDHPTDFMWVNIPYKLTGVDENGVDFANDGNVQTDYKGEVTFEITYDKLGRAPSTEYLTASLLVTKLKADNTLDTRLSCKYELRQYGRKIQTAAAYPFVNMFKEQPQYAEAMALDIYNGYPQSMVVTNKELEDCIGVIDGSVREVFIEPDGGDFVLEFSDTMKCINTGVESFFQPSFDCDCDWIDVRKLNDYDNRLYVRVDFYRVPSLEVLDPSPSARSGEVIIELGEGREYRITLKQYPLSRQSNKSLSMSNSYLWDLMPDGDRAYFTGSENTDGELFQKKLTDGTYYAVRSYNLLGYYYVDYIFYTRTGQGDNLIIKEIESWGLEIVRQNGENSYSIVPKEEFGGSGIYINDFLTSKIDCIMDN
ncbi:MAG: InlB B-repeat-containing protein [Clostridiales bacterium]|nr:InlB B-repeat-containing protein [Clostridiales bacterium]